MTAGEDGAPTVVDLFAGAGGFSLGFRRRGFRILHAVDNFAPAVATYQENLPDVEVHRVDVRDVAPGTLGAPDVVIGGPPCEAFTVANADRRPRPRGRLYEDPLGSLTIQFILHLKALQPEVFVMENVPGILEGDLEWELMDLLDRAGYGKVHANQLEATEHGVPSRRRRVFLSNLRIQPPVQDPPPTLWEVIGDLEPLGADVANHEDHPLSNERRRRVAELETGESLYRYEAADGRTFHSWTRLPPDEVAPTVKGSSRFVHPTQPRLLTVREHARLLGYPDDFVLVADRTHQYDLVGESVPPPLAEAVAREVRRAFDG